MEKDKDNGFLEVGQLMAVAQDDSFIRKGVIHQDTGGDDKGAQDTPGHQERASNVISQQRETTRGATANDSPEDDIALPPTTELRRTSAERTSLGPGAHSIGVTPTEDPAEPVGPSNQHSNDSGVERSLEDPNEPPLTSAKAVTTDDLMEEIISRAVEAKVEPEPSMWQRYRVCFISGVILLAAVAVVAAVSVSQSRDKSPAPTQSPTISPMTRLTTIEDLIEDTFNSTSWKIENSPQALALQWIAMEDEYRADVMTDQDLLIQRYVLAVLFFSTNGTDWDETFEFLSADNECNWSGALQCNENGEITGIDLQDNNLVGSLPLEISKLSNLQSLIMTGNSLTGSIATQLQELLQLVTLDLSDNDLNYTIPDALFTMTNLEMLGLAENSLTGSISSNIGSLAKLTSLSLGLNSLSGRIPDSLWDLSHMRTLAINEQFKPLFGTLSPKLGDWKNVTELQIHRNSMTGTLPSEIGHLTLLTNLQAGANDFTGMLPTEFGNLESLSRISLSVNGLTGTVPTEFLKLSELSKVYLQNTLLSDDWTWMCDAIDAGTFGPLRPMRADLDEVNCTCFGGSKFHWDAANCAALRVVYNQFIEKNKNSSQQQ